MYWFGASRPGRPHNQRDSQGQPFPSSFLSAPKAVQTRGSFFGPPGAHPILSTASLLHRMGGRGTAGEVGSAGLIGNNGLFKVACERCTSCGCGCVARDLPGGPPRELCLFSFCLVEMFVPVFVLEPTEQEMPQERKRNLHLGSALDFREFSSSSVAAGSPRAIAVGQLQGGGRGWILVGESFLEVLASANTFLGSHEFTATFSLSVK